MSSTTKDVGELRGRVLLFGGPYSNLHATRSLFAESRRLGIGVDNIICSGDIVAYCGEPADTVAFIRRWGVHCVMGNCEESLANDAADCGCGFDEGTACSVLSTEWYRHADNLVTRDQRRWMGSLPRSIEFNLGGIRFVVIHGSVDSINEFVFPSTQSDHKLRNLAKTGADCIIGGHSGLPFGQALPHNEAEARNHYWINTGVIGMPANDGSPDGWYLLLEAGASAEGVIARWRRLPYDHVGAAEAMKENGLGPAYRDALITGLWPSMDVLPAAERSLQGRRLSPPDLLIDPLSRTSGVSHPDR